MMYDIAVIGKGPAGISAAINARQRNKNTIIFGRDSKKVLSSPEINNYPGLYSIKGEDLFNKFNEHLINSGAVVSEKSVTAVYTMDESFSIQAENDIIEAKAVVLSVGVDFKKSIENEDKFLGSGVSYCATCDAPLYKGKIAAVVGYNNEAINDANFLSEICTKVYFVPLINDITNLKGNVEIIKDIPIKFEGTEKAVSLVLKNSKIDADGFFVIKDSYPLGTLVPGLETNGSHVPVNRNMETNIKGLYAAGDITGKPYQIAKAAGEGQIAALSAVEYIDKIKK